MNKSLIVIGTIVLAAAAFVGGSKPYQQSQTSERADLASSRSANLVRPHSPIFGSESAKVTIVEFLDPACETCGAMAPLVKSLFRFLNRLSSAELEVVWTLKHLRNFYATHDVEHGNERDIRKKQERLGTIFVELIGKPQPRTRAEFAAAQLAFLKRIEQMLRIIYENAEREAVRLVSHSDGTRDEGKAE